MCMNWLLEKIDSRLLIHSMNESIEIINTTRLAVKNFLSKLPFFSLDPLPKVVIGAEDSSSTLFRYLGDNQGGGGKSPAWIFVQMDGRPARWAAFLRWLRMKFFRF